MSPSGRVLSCLVIVWICFSIRFRVDCRVDLLIIITFFLENSFGIRVDGEFLMTFVGRKFYFNREIYNTRKSCNLL